MITVVDYGMGNLGSILNMCRWLKIEAQVTSDAGEIQRANKILLPGVGAFDAAIRKINESGLRSILEKKALDEKIPIFGICLGMQLLTESSEEGILPGFGWIPAHTTKFVFTGDCKPKVPHMGWNSVVKVNESPLTDALPEDSRFYFVHSYYVTTDDRQHSILTTRYGDITFDSAIQKENIFGAQFHPEKSHKFGMKILEAFARI